jgi:predicted phage terminase large subunit-like protein
MDIVLRAAKEIVRRKQLEREEEARLRCEGSLMAYSKYVWPVVEPAIPFVEGWAIGAIAEHLQAVTEGQITRLLMNVPPGFTKSLMTDVFWPSWEWGPRNMPWLRYVCASYSNHLTERDNMRCRNIVISDHYQKRWGDRFKISNEQFTKIKFANNKTGWKLATSVGGIGVGERGDRFIIDDPNNTMEMESEDVRFKTNMWFTEVVPDRLNNPQKSAIVIIQQRLHEDDVSGVAISREMGYTHLMIPMKHDLSRHCVTVLGFEEKVNEETGETTEEKIIWEDPRVEDEELAWPERFTEEVCFNMERDKGPYAWAGQYQQYPVPRGGAIIKSEYWQLWDRDRLPNFEFIVASLDPAFTEKEENDPSALTIWGVFRDETEDNIQPVPDHLGRHQKWLDNQDMHQNPKVMLLYSWEGRLQFHDLLQKVLEVCVPELPIKPPCFSVDKLLIEAKGSGQSVGQEFHRLIRGTGRIGVELIDPKKYGDKVARVHSIEHLFRDGMIYAPDKKWADDVINQCAIFPKGSKDDLVDTTSQALRWLRDMGFALRREEYAVEATEEMTYDNRNLTAPLYWS